MPLDSSLYPLSLLRTDGRRWNELRVLRANISTQASASGSAYLEMGNTKVLCTVHGPSEGRGQRNNNSATVEVEVNIAGFSQVDRKRRGRNDKRVQELQYTVANAFQTHLFTHLYPRSSIGVTLHVLSLDGGLLASCINASTLALIDAGIPMPGYLVACTSGSTSSLEDDKPGDPVLDLNGSEEQEIPFLTVATVGNEDDRVAVLVMESRCQATGRLEGMMAVGIDGCKQVRGILEGVVRKQGKAFLRAQK